MFRGVACAELTRGNRGWRRAKEVDGCALPKQSYSPCNHNVLESSQNLVRGMLSIGLSILLTIVSVTWNEREEKAYSLGSVMSCVVPVL